jgi:CTP synthase
LFSGAELSIVELLQHRYFAGVQFHPEFKSTPFAPSPPFLGLVAASSRQLDKVLEKLSQ